MNNKKVNEANEYNVESCCAEKKNTNIAILLLSWLDGGVELESRVIFDYICLAQQPEINQKN